MTTVEEFAQTLIEELKSRIVAIETLRNVADSIVEPATYVLTMWLKTRSNGEIYALNSACDLIRELLANETWDD